MPPAPSHHSHPACSLAQSCSWLSARSPAALPRPLCQAASPDCQISPTFPPWPGAEGTSPRQYPQCHLLACDTNPRHPARPCCQAWSFSLSPRWSPALLATRKIVLGDGLHSTTATPVPVTGLKSSGHSALGLCPTPAPRRGCFAPPRGTAKCHHPFLQLGNPRAAFLPRKMYKRRRNRQFPVLFLGLASRS